MPSTRDKLLNICLGKITLIRYPFTIQESIAQCPLAMLDWGVSKMMIKLDNLNLTITRGEMMLGVGPIKHRLHETIMCFPEIGKANKGFHH